MAGSFQVVPLNDTVIDDNEAPAASVASFSNGSMTAPRQGLGHGRSRNTSGRRSSASSSYRRMSSSSSLPSRKDAKEGVGLASRPPMPENPKRRPSVRKRKSDDLDRVDLNMLLREHEQEVKEDHRSHHSASFSSSNSSSVFQTKGPNGSNTETSNATQTSIFCHTTEEKDQIRPIRSIFDDMAFVADMYGCDFGGITGRSSASSTSTGGKISPSPSSSSSRPSTVPQTPTPHETFRSGSTDRVTTPKVFHGGFNPYSVQHGDSPCSVTGLFNNGCGSFWERSLAWSEDEQDEDVSDGRRSYVRRSSAFSQTRPLYTADDNDYDDDDYESERRSIVREQLSVPQCLGKEYMNDDHSDVISSPVTVDSVDVPVSSITVEGSSMAGATMNTTPVLPSTTTTLNGNPPPRRSTSSNSLNTYSTHDEVQQHKPYSHRRIKTLETDSRQRRGSKMFRQTDIDEVTEIHWEEQLIDLDSSSAIDLFSKLSLK